MDGARRYGHRYTVDNSSRRYTLTMLRPHVTRTGIGSCFTLLLTTCDNRSRTPSLITQIPFFRRFVKSEQLWWHTCHSCWWHSCWEDALDADVQHSGTPAELPAPCSTPTQSPYSSLLHSLLRYCLQYDWIRVSGLHGTVQWEEIRD